MTTFVTSPDGTRIAFDRLGQGPPVVVVGGLFNDRQTTHELAERLSQRLTVINYDRRAGARAATGRRTPWCVWSRTSVR